MNVNLFRDHPLTRGFSSQELQQLTQLLSERSYPADTSLCREGAPIDGLFLVAAGRVSVTKRDADGAPQNLAELEGPTILGELEFVGGTACAATVVARSDVKAYLLQASALETLAGSSAVTVAKLLRNISREVVLRLLALNERYVDAAKGWGSVFADG